MLLVVGNAFAKVIIEKPGCYIVSGISQSLNSNELMLKTFPDSRSEETLKIVLQKSNDFERLKLKTGTPVSVQIQVKGKGSPSHLRLSARMNDVRIPESFDDLHEKVWRPCPKR